MSILFLLSLSCIERRVMPEKLNKILVFDIDIIGSVSTEQKTETFLQDLTVSIDVKQTNRDDSLLLELNFVEAKWKVDTEDAVWKPYALQGRSFFVTAFPWGEMLKIEGWEALPPDPYLDTLDIIVPLLFPNPPVRESQQWDYRVLPWRYQGELPENYMRLNQKIIANWTRDTESVWTYEGEWLARTRLAKILQGEVKGQIEKSGAWIDSHEWDWRREIVFPKSNVQHFRGKLRRVQ